MSEHFTELNVERYRSRLMSPAELLDADDHLAACEACRLKTRLKTVDAVRTEATLTSLRTDLYIFAGAETGHLAYEQIEALVDNQITSAARETIEEHIKTCAPCAEEVRDLSAFKSTLVTTADQPTRAASLTTAGRFAAFWHWPSEWAWPQFVTAAALLLIATAALLLFVRKPTDLTPTELAQRNPTPPIVQPSSSPVTGESPQPLVDATPDGSAPVPQSEVPLSPPPATNSPVEIVIALNDGGGRVTLDRRGNVAGLDHLSPASQPAVRAALTTGAVKIPREVAELSRNAGTLMGEASDGVAFPLVSPVGVVRTDRPTLRWQPLSGATNYTVTLLDSRMNVVATSPPLNAIEWTVPSTLTRGGTYTWQVTAVKDGREIISPAAPAPEARFKVLERSKASELERMERAKVRSHLTRGVLYAEAGLLSDAEREFAALVKSNPRSRVAQNLLRSAQATRRHEAKAERK